MPENFGVPRAHSTVNAVGVIDSWYRSGPITFTLVLRAQWRCNIELTNRAEAAGEQSLSPADAVGAADKAAPLKAWIRSHARDVAVVLASQQVKIPVAPRGTSKVLQMGRRRFVRGGRE